MKSSAKRIPCRRLFPSFAAALALAAALNAQAVPYPETVLADNPAVYYRMEDASGFAIITNAVNPEANAGTILTDMYSAYPKLQQPGLGSNSVSFHLYTPEGGTLQNSRIEVPYSPILNPAGPFTVEFWARATSWGDQNRCIIGNIGGYSEGWWFRQETGSTPRWLYVQNGGGVYMAGGKITKNEWAHLVVTYDGTRFYFYANGEEQWKQADGTIPLLNQWGPLSIGGDSSTGDGFFDGNVDELAIYTNALTLAQVQLHYAVGLTNFAVPKVAPSVAADPAAVSAYAGRTATFVVSVDGTAPLSYQWYKGGTPIEGATGDMLQLTCAYADNGAAYKVAVTNPYGAVTSAPATLTVMTDLMVVTSPASVVRNVGSKAAFLAVPGGALPVTCQWYAGSTPIPGATNQTLWLSNLQLTNDATTVYAQLANPWMTTNTDPATVTVVPRAVTVPITDYAKVVMADDPVAYWRLDEPSGSATAVDAAGSFDGAYTPRTGTLTYGVATGIPHETNKAVSVTAKSEVLIPWALELNPYGPFSVEAWFNPASLASNGDDYRTVFSSETPGPGWNSPHGWLLYQQPDNTLVWVIFSQDWNSIWLGDWTFNIAANNWYHIVLTYDGEVFSSYLNGAPSASQAYPEYIPNQDTATSLGWRSDEGWNPFDGVLDDVAFYNKALTAEQVQAHYLATVRLNMTRSGSQVILSWPFGTLQQADSVSGVYVDMPTATSPCTNSIGVSTKCYRVKIQ